MENIGKVYGFGGESPEQPEELVKLEEKRHIFNEKAMSVLEKIKEKDSTVHFNWDTIGNSEQAIAFTKNGRIIVHNSFYDIVIEQDGKENIKFPFSDEEKALTELQNIVSKIS